MNTFLTILDFSDVRDSPKVRASLPGPLLLGSIIDLNLTVRRRVGPRSEELKAKGPFQVEAVSFQTKNGLTQQLLTVHAVQVAPSWKAIKNRLLEPRTVPKAKSPRTPI